MDSRVLLKDISKKLQKSEKITEPELEARWILERAAGVDESAVIAGIEIELEDVHQDFIESAVTRRLEGVPLAYILGEKEFYSLSFVVNPNVLIPRPESEHIVEEAIVWSKKNNLKEPRILDLGAGSGCIGLSVAKNLEGSKLCSVDVSVEALDVVDFNSKSLGLNERSSLLYMQVEEMNSADLPEFFEGKADLILANPPYVDEGDPEIEDNVKKYEPAMALFADEQGYGSIRRWSKQLEDLMAPTCLVLFEVGSSQGQRSKEIFEELEIFDTVEVLKDYSGRERIVRAERHK